MKAEKNQLATAEAILDEAAVDGHEFDLTAIDLLDYMACYGVSFGRSNDASVAYIGAVAAEMREED